MNPKSMAPMNSGSFRLQMSEFGPSSSAVAPILARYARKVGSPDPASVRALALASNLRSQFITHLLNLRSTASRLLSHHSALANAHVSMCRWQLRRHLWIYSGDRFFVDRCIWDELGEAMVVLPGYAVGDQPHRLLFIGCSFRNY